MSKYQNLYMNVAVIDLVHIYYFCYRLFTFSSICQLQLFKYPYLSKLFMFQLENGFAKNVTTTSATTQAHLLFASSSQLVTERIINRTYQFMLSLVTNTF